MSDGIKPRTTQGRVKHDILARYLKAWGGIITNGLKVVANQHRREGKPFELHFVYIDCNASNGRFNGELEDQKAGRERHSVFGSAIIGVKGLDAHADWVRQKNIAVRTNAILVEMDNRCYEELKRSLEMAGLGNRVKETNDFFSLQDGEIALVKGDSTALAPEIVKYTQAGHKFPLYFLDPYGPKGIPLSYVKLIISRDRHDVIINMPYQDLHKKSGILDKTNLTPADRAKLQNYNDMFGSTRWQSIARQIDADTLWEEEFTASSTEPSHISPKGSDARHLEASLMQCYKEALQRIDPQLTVKSIGLHFPDRERTMFYLYLTTHDPDGAMQMNKVLRDASYQERELRWRLKQANQLRGGQMTMTLFDISPSFNGLVGAADKEEVAEHIQQLLGGQALSKKGVYRALADENYLPEEIDSALNYLRKQGRAGFEGTLNKKTVITIEKPVG